jgi:hypothetical protein
MRRAGQIGREPRHESGGNCRPERERLASGEDSLERLAHRLIGK